MPSPISFCHVVNPFVAPAGSEHRIASDITFASLRRAVDDARAAGIDVEVRAVVLDGDEPAAQPPAVLARRLSRTVQDVRPLKPVRPLPLIADILRNGTEGARGSHVIFTNMDIAVQPYFYTALRDLVLDRFGEDVPFIVYRRNIAASFTRVDELPAMYAANGEVAYGFDCFVFPARYVPDLDLGDSCIGSAHFDNLLLMSLDAASGFRMRRVNDVALTFHLGNEIEWARHMDYIEHNLREAMAAIERMSARRKPPADSLFAHQLDVHFRPNARVDSAVLRRVKRLPGVGTAVHRMKKWIGRSH